MKRVLIWSAVLCLAAGLVSSSFGLDYKGRKTPTLKVIEGTLDCTWLDTVSTYPVVQTRTMYPGGVTTYCGAAYTIVFRMKDEDVTAEMDISLPAGAFYTVPGPVAAIRVIAATDTIAVDRWLW